MSSDSFPRRGEAVGQRKTTRRRFILTVAGASATAATSGAIAPTTTDSSTTSTTSTTSTAPATRQAASVEDVAVLARLTGHDFNSAEIEMMADDVEANREKLLELHARTIDPRVEPAVTFDPRLPGVNYPSGDSSF